MRKFILSFAILAFAMGAKAQDTRFSIAANAGIPTTTGLSFAVGGDVQADFGVAASTFITASAGYENYSVKGGGSYGMIPLLAGAKFGFGESGVYGHAQLGYSFSTTSGGGGAFAYAPSIGYNFSKNFDGSLKYLASSKNGFTTGSLNVRLAYNF